MKKITAILVTSMFSVSAFAFSGGSITRFFDKNPELKKSESIKIAVTTQARSTAMVDIKDDLPDGDYLKVIAVIDEHMQENGYDYAVTAVKDMYDICENGEGGIYGLSEEDCTIIKQYKAD